MKPVFILLYGLPGSGKTTLAKCFATYADFQFIDMTGIKKNFQNHIEKNLKSVNTITEGVYSKPERRNKILEMASETHEVICVYIHEDYPVLASRRDMKNIPRYSELYREMIVEVDNVNKFAILSKSLKDRISDLDSLINLYQSNKEIKHSILGTL